MLGSAVTCHALNARSCQQVFVSHLQMKQQCPYLYIARVSARFHSTWFHFTMKHVSSALHEETEPGAVQQHFQVYSCHRAEADCGVTALPRPALLCGAGHLTFQCCEVVESIPTWGPPFWLLPLCGMLTSSFSSLVSAKCHPFRAAFLCFLWRVCHLIPLHNTLLCFHFLYRNFSIWFLCLFSLPFSATAD